MTVGDLLADLRRRGIGLRTEGDMLRVRPGNRVTPADRARLRAYKPALLPLLRDAGELTADGTAERLRAVYDRLAPADRARLADDARQGDRLAGLLLLAIDAEASA